MKAPHDWAMGWPGNFCKRCGMDDPTESALACDKCVLPCHPDDTFAPIICPDHQEMYRTGCVQWAVILHPTARDPYGLLTVGQLHEAHRHAISFVAGWHAATYTQEIPEAPYDEILYFLMCDLWDMPYEHACQVALYMTSPQSEYSWQFRPVL